MVLLSYLSVYRWFLNRHILRFYPDHLQLQLLTTIQLPFTMRFTIIASALLAPLAVLAAPMEAQAGSNMIVERQSTPPKPAPCVPNPKTTVEQTKQRAQAFAQAFIYHPNITEAFTYINSGYIVSWPPAYISRREHC